MHIQVIFKRLEIHVTALFISTFGLLQSSNGTMTLRVSPTQANVKAGKTLGLSRAISEKKFFILTEQSGRFAY